MKMLNPTFPITEGRFLIQKFSVRHSPFSPNLQVGDSLFQPIITELKRKYFLNDQVMKEAVQNFLEAREKNYFLCTYVSRWTGGPST
jgi:hypothetical protein